MWQQMVQVLREFNLVSVCVRLVLAMVFGGVIGLERGIRRRPAGLRTYMLVCVGAALVMMTNEYLIINFGGSDPARLGAQVVSGIGFLGAGTIIVTRHQQVKGLTTAAGLWASACMGLAIGIGFYEGAVVGTILIFFIITVMHPFDNKVVSTSRSMELFVEFSKDGGLSEFLSMVIDRKIKVVHVEIVQARQGDKGRLATIISLKLPQRHAHYDVIRELRDLPGIAFIEEV